MGSDLNRSTQHLISNDREGDVENEAATGSRPTSATADTRSDLHSKQRSQNMYALLQHKPKKAPWNKSKLAGQNPGWEDAPFKAKLSDHCPIAITLETSEDRRVSR